MCSPNSYKLTFNFYLDRFDHIFIYNMGNNFPYL